MFIFKFKPFDMNKIRKEEWGMKDENDQVRNVSELNKPIRVFGQFHESERFGINGNGYHRATGFETIQAMIKGTVAFLDFSDDNDLWDKLNRAEQFLQTIEEHQCANEETTKAAKDLVKI